jgi:hypothetical protein
MPTVQKTNVGPHHLNELVGQVIGLYGDPTNQDVLAGGVTLSQTFTNITYGGSDLQKNLFWSRVVLCAIFNPFDSTYKRTRIALVLRPRALWLFQKGGGIADYADNEVSAAAIGTANADSLITSVNPAYNFGDLIRIGTLPSALNAVTWADDYTRLYNEYYNAQATTIRDSTLSISGMTINASGFIPSIANFSVSKIVYYDKNTDARTRIVGGGDTGATVTLPVCLGGVTAVYQLKGTRIS